MWRIYHIHLHYTNSGFGVLLLYVCMRAKILHILVYLRNHITLTVFLLLYSFL